MTTMTEKLLKSLKNGSKLSNAQIQSRFGFASHNSVTGTIYRLREQGWNIVTKQSPTGVTKYALG